MCDNSRIVKSEVGVFSLINDLKIPKEWLPKDVDTKKSAEWIEYFQRFCLKYSLIDENDQIKFNIINDFITTFTMLVYPMANKKEFKIAWLVSYFGTLLDKHGEGAVMTEPSKQLLQSCQQLLYRGLSNETLVNFQKELIESKGIEKKSILVFIYKLAKYCKRNSIKWMGSHLLSEFTRWMDSLIPFKDLNDASIETFLFIRQVNVGHHFYLDLTLLMSIKNLDPMILFSSGLFQKVCLLSSKEISLVNDIYSYEKEVITDPNSPNLLNNLILKKNMTFKESYYNLVSYINNLYNEILVLKNQFLNDTKSNLNLSPKDSKELDEIMKNMFYLNGGNLIWSGTCIRYATQNSAFKELNETFLKNKLKFFKDKNFLDS